MSKLKLTKSELKRQRDSLKQFQRYLPTLQLKKQQLQSKIGEVRRELKQIKSKLNSAHEDVRRWSGLLNEAAEDFLQWTQPLKIEIETVNIAGANIPVLQSVSFPVEEYDFYSTPFWYDEGLKQLREFVRLLIESQVVQAQINRLEHELRVTSQRVNLFEKVKIPECQENIRKIRINLGDQQANAVGISKVAKKKIETANLEGALV